METVCVLIPIYKKAFGVLERISLLRIHEVLSAHKIFYIEPESLDFYDEYVAGVYRFDDRFFSSIKAYNALLLSPEFYKTFLNFKYILICQLDVFLFSDRLIEFCNLGYDYYGAPWIYGTPINAGEGFKILFSGNGGLSLRNVEKTLDLLKENQEKAKSFTANEDFFFSYYSSRKYRVAPTTVSSKFCVETHVRRCMKMNRGELPFGTHAWERYDFCFWKPYIEACGIDLSGVFVKDGDEDRRNKKGVFRRVTAMLIRIIIDLIKKIEH